ncbi:MAG: hypothetical protein QOJ55_1217, partial [Solirubrobacteraceae bacterium]|nr:hypothetical protein [Solirubrobacteraceae bacterium]
MGPSTASPRGRPVVDPADFDIAGVRAENPGPFTLSGTNT